MLCRICEQETVEQWLIAKGYRVGKCEYCGFVQVLDVPNSDELNQLYETLHKKHLKYRSAQSARLENQRRLLFLLKHLPIGACVLDAGCATGDFIAEAAESFEMHGFDLSSAAIEYAKQRLPQLNGRLKAQRLEDVEVPLCGGFDAVCLWDVIEHVVDPVMILQRMMDHLKPGGLLVISTPDVNSLTARIMRSNWAFMIPPYHMGYFSKQSFEYLFANKVFGEIIDYTTRGKAVNFLFILYKLNQMKRWLAPKFLIDFAALTKLGQLKMYIPTNDIAYMAVRKPVNMKHKPVFGD